MLLNRHTTSKMYELTGQQGRTVTVTPGTGQTQVQFLCQAMPTQKDSKFWYYVEDIWVKAVVTIAVTTDSLFAGFQPYQLWQVIASMSLQTPILGMLFQNSNTRGAVLGNVIMPVSFGYNQLPRRPVLGAGGNTTVTYELWYRLPFAQHFLANPMETAPWAGFLEGGTLTVNVAPSNVFVADVNANSTVTSVVLSATAFMQPAPEARIHAPCHWREHESAQTNKHVITDMGSPDGLQGIDQSKGCGIAALYQATGPASSGLLAATTLPNILNVTIPWRDQPLLQDPTLLSVAQYKAFGASMAPGYLEGTAVGAELDWPYTPGALGTSLNSTQALVQSLIAPGTNVYTSKLQTVAGAKEIVLNYTSPPEINSRFFGCYFPVFDDEFKRSLVARIAPTSSGKTSAKTLNKQAGGVAGVGKLAYTAQKVDQG